MADQSFTYDTAQNLKANTFTKTGYNFDGWTTENGGTNYSAEQSLINLTAENNAVITLYAKWKIAKYQVNFSAEGGNGSLSASIDGNPFTGGEVEYGKTVVFTAAPNAKFHVDTCLIDLSQSNNIAACCKFFRIQTRRGGIGGFCDFSLV